MPTLTATSATAPDVGLTTSSSSPEPTDSLGGRRPTAAAREQQRVLSLAPSPERPLCAHVLTRRNFDVTSTMPDLVTARRCIFDASTRNEAARSIEYAETTEGGYEMIVRDLAAGRVIQVNLTIDREGLVTIDRVSSCTIDLTGSPTQC